jgi:hypothetical protein
MQRTTNHAEEITKWIPPMEFDGPDVNGEENDDIPISPQKKDKKKQGRCTLSWDKSLARMLRENQNFAFFKLSYRKLLFS